MVAKQTELENRVACGLKSPVEKFIPSTKEWQDSEEKKSGQGDYLVRRFTLGTVVIDEIKQSCCAR